MAKTGGYMPGGGRPKGSRNKKTQEFIERVASEGVMPLDILLGDMRYYHKLVTKTLKKVNDDETALNDEDAKKATAWKSLARECAEKAAPYLHPRLASVDSNVHISTHEEALEELEKLK